MKVAHVSKKLAAVAAAGLLIALGVLLLSVSADGAETSFFLRRRLDDKTDATATTPGGGGNLDPCWK